MLDILFVGAHPDDEQIVSGLLLKAKKAGLSTGVVILTKGEAGGFASKETRVKELINAKNVMKLDFFQNLDIADGNVEFSTNVIEQLIPYFVKTQPKLVITIHPDDYHPDHIAVSKIVDKAVFVSGLKKNTGGKTWHPSQILYASLDARTNNKNPDILINIDDVIEEKRNSLKCYKSQQIEQFLMINAQYLGSLAGCKYAEGLYHRQPLIVNSVETLIHGNQIGR